MAKRGRKPKVKPIVEVKPKRPRRSFSERLQSDLGRVLRQVEVVAGAEDATLAGKALALAEKARELSGALGDFQPSKGKAARYAEGGVARIRESAMAAFAGLLSVRDLASDLQILAIVGRKANCRLASGQTNVFALKQIEPK